MTEAEKPAEKTAQKSVKTRPAPQISGFWFGGLGFVILFFLMISTDYWRPQATKILSEIFGAPPEQKHQVMPDDLLVLQNAIQALAEQHALFEKSTEEYLEVLYTSLDDYDEQIAAIQEEMTAMQAFLSEANFVSPQNLPPVSAQKIADMQENLAKITDSIDSTLHRIASLESVSDSAPKEKFAEMHYLIRVGWSMNILHQAVLAGADFTKELHALQERLHGSDRKVLAEPLAILARESAITPVNETVTTETASEDDLLQQIWGEIRGLVKVSKQETSASVADPVKDALQALDHWLHERQKEI